MSLKSAAFFAFIGMTLLTVVCAMGFIGDISALLGGAIAPMMVLNSLVHLLASLSVAISCTCSTKRSLEIEFVTAMRGAAAKIREQERKSEWRQRTGV